VRLRAAQAGAFLLPRNICRGRCARRTRAWPGLAESSQPLTRLRTGGSPVCHLLRGRTVILMLICIAPPGALAAGEHFAVLHPPQDPLQKRSQIAGGAKRNSCSGRLQASVQIVHDGPTARSASLWLAQGESVFRLLVRRGDPLSLRQRSRCTCKFFTDAQGFLISPPLQPCSCLPALRPHAIHEGAALG